MTKKLVEALVIAIAAFFAVLAFAMLASVAIAFFATKSLSLDAILKAMQASQIKFIVFVVAPAAAAFSFVFALFNALFNSLSKKEVVLRGVRRLSTKEMQRELDEKFGKESRFCLSKVRIPVNLETRNFLIVGSPGTGKSVAITSVLDALREQGAGIVADVDGIYLSRFFDPQRDVLLNPADARSIAWSPLAEIAEVADCASIARAIIPEGTGNSKEWNTYAQVLLEGVLEYCHENRLKNRDIIYYMLEASIDELQKVLAGKAARMYANEEIAKMFLSIRSVAATYVKFLSLLDGNAGSESFSIKKFVQSEQRGWIFLAYMQNHRDVLAAVVSCALDVAARAILDLKPDLRRRFVYCVDEFSLLPPIPKVYDLLTNGRKYGAVVMLGMQSVSQIAKRYSAETAKEMLNSLQTILATRCADNATAEFVSRQVGDVDVMRILHSSTRSATAQSVTRNTQVQTQRALLASEIQSLKDLNAILFVASIGFTQIELEIVDKKEIAQSFVQRKATREQEQREHAMHTKATREQEQPEHTTHAKLAHEQEQPEHTTHAKLAHEQEQPEHTAHTKVAHEQEQREHATHEKAAHEQEQREHAMHEKEYEAHDVSFFD